jgi:hypothetical protein
MTQQTVTFGSGQYSSWVAYAAGADTTSNWNVTASVTTAEAPLTGSYTNTTGRPIQLTSLTLYWWASANPTSTSIDFQISLYANGSGGVQSGATNANGSSTGVTLNYHVDQTAGTRYYGFYKNDSGNVRFYSYASTGNNIYYNGTVDWADRREYGAIVVRSVPNAPTSFVSTSQTASTVSFSWVEPSDLGSTLAIQGYRICYRENSLANVAANWKVATLSSQVDVGNSGTNATTATVIDLNPSTKYDFQVAALNTVTYGWNGSSTNYSATSDHTGTRSAVVTANTTGGIYTGTAWVPPTATVYTASATWANANVMVYNGTAWVNWGYRP